MNRTSSTPRHWPAVPVHVSGLLLSPHGSPAEEQTYIVRFYLHGVLGIIEKWLRQDRWVPIPHVTRLIVQCVKSEKSADPQ